MLYLGWLLRQRGKSRKNVIIREKGIFVDLSDRWVFGFRSYVLGDPVDLIPERKQQKRGSLAVRPRVSWSSVGQNLNGLLAPWTWAVSDSFLALRAIDA